MKSTSLFFNLYNNIKYRFLFIGIINTSFGYIASIFIYNILSKYIPFTLLLVIINIVNITFSFITHKTFTFRSKGNFFYEYIRTYISNIASILIGFSITWVMVNLIHIEFWIAQLFSIIIGTIFLYFAHSRFTFRNKTSY